MLPNIRLSKPSLPNMSMLMLMVDGRPQVTEAGEQVTTGHAEADIAPCVRYIVLNTSRLVGWVEWWGIPSDIFALQGSFLTPLR